jgi:CHAT domain-containing protein
MGVSIGKSRGSLLANPLLILLLFLFLFTGVISGNVSEKKLNQSFYLLVDSIRSKPVDDRITDLQQFLTKHPGYVNVYLTLLEWYTYHNKLELGKAYFQKLAKESAYAQNAYWILTKIYQLEDIPGKAFQSFIDALKVDDPPVELLYEFIEFDHYQLYRFKGASILRELSLTKDVRRLLKVFYAYFQQNDSSVIAILLQLNPSLTEQAIVLDVWGNSYYYTSRPCDAKTKWQIGYQLVQQQHNLRMQARFLTNLGFYAQEADKDYDLALTRYDSASAIASQTLEYHRMQMLSGYRGYLYRDKGFFREAEKCFKEAILICSNLKQPRFLADWQKGYGLTLFHLARYREAFDAIYAGEQIARKSNNIIYIVNTLLDRAELYLDLKQQALAKKDIREAYQLANSNQMIFERETAEVKQGQILLQEKEYSKARRIFKGYIQYLEETPTYRKEIYQWTGKVAETYFLEGNFEQAQTSYMRAYKEAKAVDARNFQGWYQLRLGDIALQQGRPNDAVQHYDDAFNIASAENVTEMLWEIYRGYGNFYRQCGEFSRAIRSYQQAARLVEKTRRKLDVDRLRIGYFVEGHTVYKKLVDCYLERYKLLHNPNDLDSIFVYHSMGRSRDLLDLQQQRGKISYSKEYKQSVAELQTLQRLLRLNTIQLMSDADEEPLNARLMNVRLTLLEQRVRLFKSDVEEKLPERPSFPSLFQISNYLKQIESGLLLYHITKQNSFVLVITEEKSDIVALEGIEENIAMIIDSLVAPFHYDFNPDSVHLCLFRADIAYKLYQKLIKPIEDTITLPENLLLVPDNPIMNLPFEMLLSGKADRPVYSPVDDPDYAKHFLVQRYSITYTPHIRFLENTLSQSFRDPSMVVFANPYYYLASSPSTSSQISRSRSGWYFGPLPYAEFEADQIQQIHEDTEVLIGSQATKSVLKTEITRNEIVHIATHGFVDSTFDAFSGLALALSSDSIDDGLFMGYEILDLEMNCDLVTLSACETGRGKLVAGEGVLGLPRLFLGAGAKTVLMTLWKIQDKFAFELMPGFYDYFLNQNLTKSGALSQAKRKIIQNKNRDDGSSVYYQHPFYWAAFTLYGDPGRSSGQFAELTNPWIWVVLITIIGISGLIILLFFYLKKQKEGNDAQSVKKSKDMTKRAVCIGIDKYPDPDRFKPLKGCVNDAEDWAELLKNKFDFGDEIEIILDEEATKDRILDALEQMITEAEKGDILVFTLSCHGTWVPDEGELDEPDFRDEAVWAADGKIIRDDEIRKVINLLEPGVSLTMIIDSCYSGGVTMDGSPVPNLFDGKSPQGIRFVPPQADDYTKDDVSFYKPALTIEDFSKFPIGRRFLLPIPKSDRVEILIAACDEAEICYETEKGDGEDNGVMTSEAISIIRDNPDQTYREFHKELRERLPSVKYPQSPQLEGTETDKDRPLFTNDEHDEQK